MKITLNLTKMQVEGLEIWANNPNMTITRLCLDHGVNLFKVLDSIAKKTVFETKKRERKIKSRRKMKSRVKDLPPLDYTPKGSPY